MNRQDPPDRLEQLVHELLRNQPPRRAPADLQSRVLAAIERRNARAWWRKKLADWPLVARAAFVLLCVVTMKVGVDASVWLMARVGPAEVVAGLASIVTWTKMLVAVTATIARNVPAAWSYGYLFILAATYAALFGAAAAAYRTVYRPLHHRS